jgi:hypothetical protein
MEVLEVELVAAANKEMPVVMVLPVAGVVAVAEQVPPSLQ